MTTTKSELKDSEYYDDLVGLNKEKVDDSDLEKEEDEQIVNLEKETQPQESIVENSSVEIDEEENDDDDDGEDNSDVDNSEALLDEEDLAELRVEDKIPFHKVGRHRRIRFEDLMNYKTQIDRDRMQALDELAAQAQELDMGYE